MPASPVRVRIAPSPTGEPHIGTAYTALFNVLLARKLGGAMILRIEDTDQTRSTPEAEARLMEALDWLDLPWAEGPRKGGPHAPYRQSERREIYRAHVETLLEKGHAFKCFCTKERLDVMREAQRAAGKQPKYDGKCLSLDPAKARALEKEGTPFVVRMRIPEEGQCEFEDQIFGRVSMPYETVDMQVILKADGMPTYHLANVVDDHLMEITHVARGEEWMTSMPKHLLLYEYFGWEPPVFYHLPLMRNPDRSKLSKRRNPTSLSYFSGIGFLPEALLNYLGLFFASVPEGEEAMDLDELAKVFDPASIAKGGPVFDMQKLYWLNARWIRERLSEEAFRDRVFAWACADGRLEQALELSRARINVLGDLPPLAGFLLSSEVSLTRADFENIKTGAEASLEAIEAVRPMVDTLDEWTPEAIEAELRRIAEERGQKLRAVLPPLFLAITGSSRSLPLFQSMALLGRAMVRQRLKAAADLLGQPSGPKEKKTPEMR